MPQASCANHLLAALRPEDYQRLQPHLQETVLEQGQLLCWPGKVVTHVFFPTTALASLVCSTRAGESIEVAVIGTEGAVGYTFALHDQWSHGQAVVRRSGVALRMPLPLLRQEFNRGGPVALLLMRSSELLRAQMAQTALCSHMHRLEEQLCRWILVSMDRCNSTRIDATQQQVADMLGVRREGVSTAVSRLQEAGAIHWGRGRLQVTDRTALESRCCECYGAMRAASVRLFGGSVRHRSDAVLGQEPIERHA
jgi:CRP-like cAMP-binding protein